jgi:hypothetical protein
MPILPAVATDQSILGIDRTLVDTNHHYAIEFFTRGQDAIATDSDCAIVRHAEANNVGRSGQ